MLMWEVLLTRICALRLFFHFSFVVISNCSNCLLGIAASGTMIFVLRDIFRRRVRFFGRLFSLFYLVALALTYLFLLSYEIEGEVRIVGLADIFRFSLFNLVAAVPFFFAGTVVGLILTFNAERVNTIYGSDLFGAPWDVCSLRCCYGNSAREGR